MREDREFDRWVKRKTLSLQWWAIFVPAIVTVVGLVAQKAPDVRVPAAQATKASLSSRASEAGVTDPLPPTTGSGVESEPIIASAPAPIPDKPSRTPTNPVAPELASKDLIQRLATPRWKERQSNAGCDTYTTFSYSDLMLTVKTGNLEQQFKNLKTVGDVLEMTDLEGAHADSIRVYDSTIRWGSLELEPCPESF